MSIDAAAAWPGMFSPVMVVIGIFGGKDKQKR